ncbi:hypothetical protein [Flavicella sp.]|uniref:hypothetical protein n=1 Tax=Flavicella sp. TaxID=2957742 RepID=UPI00262AFB41|nr:hypothetical protein [Flavicella sp.]MDG1804725.1 hypothetical protein [Flavicella sp.]
MKNLFVYSILTVILLLSFSCRKDFSTIPSQSDNLSFSAPNDTIFLDTVFSNISTSTYSLKVYNNSSNDIHIPSIYLGRSDSYYRLNVDGLPGTSFDNVPLRAKDSLFIFIEGTINYSATNPIYTDSIIFDSGMSTKNIKLVTLVQDAQFIYVNNEIDTTTVVPYFLPDASPKNIHYLSDEEIAVFNDVTDEKSIVFYGYCGVPENKTLSIAANKKLHFHKNSALVIEKDASLIINGTLDEKVFIEGDRLEPEFSDRPGQWDAIWLRAGSKGNSINYLNNKNGRFGIVCDSLSTDGSTPTLTISNTELYNHAEIGLLANHSNISGENLVIGSSRTSSINIMNGGNYDFNHLTIANYWSESIRRGSSLQISNIRSNGFPEETATDLTFNISNSIIDGNTTNELFLEKNESDLFSYFFQNCMFKQSESSEDPLYDFTDPTKYLDNIFNVNTNYLDTSMNKFEIGEESELINKGDITSAAKTPLDLIETDRTTAPDIGAYQHIIFPEEE